MLALRDWFLDPTSGFTYSLTPGRGPSGDPVVDFLDHRTGYCQQFAATMAVMVRALGIPARVATGFVPGTEQEDGSLLVTAHDAHAWVEVPFAGVGWLAFDPTPPGARGASDAGAEGAQGAEGEGAEAGEPDQGEESPGTDQHGADAAAPGADGQVDDLGPGAPGQPDSLGEGGEPGPVPTRGRWRLVLGTAGAALLLMAFAPRVVRGLVRGHRLSSRSLSRPGAASRVWDELEDLALDHGVALDQPPLRPGRVAPTLRSRAEHLARAARLDPRAQERLAELGGGVEREWFGHGAASDVSGGARESAAEREARLAGQRARWRTLVLEVRSGLALHRTRSVVARWWPISLLHHTGSGRREPDGSQGGSGR